MAAASPVSTPPAKVTPPASSGVKIHLQPINDSQVRVQWGAKTYTVSVLNRVVSQDQLYAIVQQSLEPLLAQLSSKTHPTLNPAQVKVLSFHYDDAGAFQSLNAYGHDDAVAPTSFDALSIGRTFTPEAQSRMIDMGQYLINPVRLASVAAASLHPLKRISMQTLADGNCAANALAQCLQRPNIKEAAVQIRAEVMDYLKRNKAAVASSPLVTLITADLPLSEQTNKTPLQIIDAYIARFENSGVHLDSAFFAIYAAIHRQDRDSKPIVILQLSDSNPIVAVYSQDDLFGEDAHFILYEGDGNKGHFSAINKKYPGAGEILRTVVDHNNRSRTPQVPAKAKAASVVSSPAAAASSAGSSAALPKAHDRLMAELRKSKPDNELLKREFAALNQARQREFVIAVLRASDVKGIPLKWNQQLKDQLGLIAENPLEQLKKVINKGIDALQAKLDIVTVIGDDVNIAD
jgi:hypothetical protein